MKVDKIRKVVRLTQVVRRWRRMSLGRGGASSSNADSDSDSEPSSASAAPGSCSRRVSSGFLAIYVGMERRRFVIPTRYLNLPVFVSLLNQAEEEFGFQPTGGLVLPCEVGFFSQVLMFLERDEQRFGGFELDDFLRLASDVGFDSCKETAKNPCHGFTPVLQKARV